MYQGRFQNQKRSHPRGRKRVGSILTALVLLLTLAVGGTLAYIFTQTDQLVNTFTPGNVTEPSVGEDFNGEVKRNITVTAKGNVPVYVRVKLVSYRVNDENEPIGGEATFQMPAQLGENWVQSGSYYYYTLPVDPTSNNKTTTDLLGDETITLQAYDDADGGKQVIEVMSEVIQAQPAAAVQEAWNVTVGDNGTLLG